MKEQRVTESSITILGHEIETKRMYLRQTDLSYYPENPRIYSIINAGEEEEPSQQEIENKLAQMDHVNQLVQAIRANGGLVDPLLVRDGDLVVLEGNSRLAAYRLLAKKNPIKWGQVKCELLPADIDDDLVFSLLGEYHIIGRKDWQPFEQAGYLWRRYRVFGIDPGKMAKDMGLTQSRVAQLIEVYDLMREKDEVDANKWSYYEEFVKSRYIKRVREEHPEFDDVFSQKIKSGEIPRAIDVRDKVAVIARAGGKTLKKFITKSDTLEDCFDAAVHRGVNNALFNRLHAFRQKIYDPDVKNDLVGAAESQKDKFRFELRKIKTGIERLLKAME